MNSLKGRNGLVLIIAFVFSFLLLSILIHLDFHNFSDVVEDGDNIVRLGQESKINPKGATINLLCRNNQPFSIIIKWRMPIPDELMNRDKKVKIHDNWFKEGSSLSLEQYPPATIIATTNHRPPFKEVGFSNFDISSQEWSDTLVSKPLHQDTIRQLDALFHSMSSFSFHTNESMFRFEVTKKVKALNTINALCNTDNDLRKLIGWAE